MSVIINGTGTITGVSPGGLPDGCITSDDLANSSVTTEKLASGIAPTVASLNGGQLAGMRNRIINGDMRIDQRNAGAAITGVVNTVAYMCDRFYFQNSTGATVTIQRSTTAPTGFTNSAYVTVTSTGTPAYGFVQQNVEGNNIVGLGMNNASSNIVVSFWVRSSLIGTYSVSVQDSAYGYSYNATYSINSANTWEYKSVVVPGNAAGTWNTDNTQGLALRFALIGSGVGTPNTWVSGSHNGSTNNVNWFANAGATFYITGVQLEAGSVATAFERRSYGQELALCQRYYERETGLALPLPSANNGATNRNSGFYFCKSSKRVTPTITGSGWSYEGHHGSTPTISATLNGCRLEYLVADYRSSGGVLFSTYIDFSAEL